MHERGLAIDFQCAGHSMSGRSSACFAWMAAHAVEFGLSNLPSEPWHWSVDGS
jgi:zinc D-Ala-D-Ala carboxypeptidase